MQSTEGKTRNQCKTNVVEKEKGTITRNALTQKNERTVDFFYSLYFVVFLFLLLTVEYRIVGTTIPLF